MRRNPYQQSGRDFLVSRMTSEPSEAGAGGLIDLDRQRFQGLWDRRIGAGAGEVFDELDTLYHEPHRRYHTAAHIEHCLRLFDLAADRMDEPDAVEMALWFHDAIYDIPGEENELRSAKLFAARAGARGAERFRSKVHRLIMATTHRDPPPVTLDEAFIVDIDLSSFGLPWEEFLRDSRAVRAEFPHVPDAEFCPRQKKFLESLGARPAFCFTEFFRDRHEARARRNIERLCARLEAEGRL